MNISAIEIDFDSNMMWLALSDGRRLGVPLAYFPRLLAATPAQRRNYELSGGGTGIHWDELDEDISVQGLLLGMGDRTCGTTAWRPELKGPGSEVSQRAEIGDRPRQCCYQSESLIVSHDLLYTRNAHQ